jgi:hypothetical protein
VDGCSGRVRLAVVAGERLAIDRAVVDPRRVLDELFRECRPDLPAVWIDLDSGPRDRVMLLPERSCSKTT